jgi:hypothetical protein
MAKCIDVAAWRIPTRDEMLGFYDANRMKKESPFRGGSFLIVRKHLKVVDLYAYLRARFGEPNGFQNWLRADDSDNWIHWDFNLKADNVDVYLAATSRAVHFHIGELMADSDWIDLIHALKRDFARVAEKKSQMLKSFEKYVVFQNKFKLLADDCAQLHALISDIPPFDGRLPAGARNDQELEESQRVLKAQADRAEGLFSNCLKLRLMTPIMAEAFINMMILVFCKDDIRNDQTQYDAFVRSKISERLNLLPQHCDGFKCAIDVRTEAYRDFMRVMSRRNFELHGNVDPIREQIEVVYFEGKRPLFAQSGDHQLKFFEHLEKINEPEKVVKDYESVHLFLYEITLCLSEQHRAFFEHIAGTSYPGYEVRMKRVNRILPDYVVSSLFVGMRYDDELTL